jgi:[acyl-carrier-protein] S-malonyltransferase
VEEICRFSGAEPCNYNLPSQIVVGGAPPSVEEAARMARNRGGKVLPLNVSGAFHTSLMSDAAARFSTIVDRFDVADPVIPVVSNVTAQPMRTAQAVRDDLKRQIRMPVRWYQSIETMIGRGVSSFVEVGPGKVLTALLRRGAPNVAASTIDGAEALSAATNV